MKTREELTKILEDLSVDMLSNGEVLSFDPYIARIRELYDDSEALPLEERKEQFKELCRAELLEEDRSNAKLLGQFFLYWSEHPEKITKATKMKWEKERDKKSFNIKQRYATWVRNSKKFSVVGMLNRK